MKIARRRRLAGLAAIGAVALVAGCGGGSDDSASSSAASTAAVAELSADEFRTQANAICADAQTKIDAVPDPTSPADIPTVFSQVLPVAQERLDKLRALDPPADLQGSYDEALDLGQQQLDLGEQISDRIEGGEDATAVFTELEPQLEGIEEQSDAKAAELGITECAGEEDTSTSTTPTTSTTTAPPAVTDPGTSTSSASGVVEPSQYLSDVQGAAGALSSFGTLLQSVSSPSDLRTNAPQARQQLDAFDAAIDKLGTYRLEDARLERQRAGLARTGPRVSETLRDFTDAAQKGDLEEIQRLVPEIQSAIGDFQSAATDVG
jgi:type II secretory pathway pseudopilin PulG